VRVFLAGATGVIGRRLVPLLVQAGHQVTGMTRSPTRSQQLIAAGAEAAVVDALDEPAVHAAVAAAEPDAVIHQLTSLPAKIDPRKIERDFALNDRLRSEGTSILVAAARDAGPAVRVIAQSIAFMYEPGPPGTIHDELDPLLSDPPPAFARTAGAVRTLERTVLQAGGLVLRYGYFYGPGSAISREGSFARDLARRRLPIVGRGEGVWSFIHVDDAAAATVLALDHGKPGIYNITDDEPVPQRVWVPELARLIGARKPLHLPAWLVRLMVGRYFVLMGTQLRGNSNAKARAELGCEPRFPHWREGFAAVFGGARERTAAPA
jgi:2-alkyl-3-oxoalkanoate reductase